MESLGRWGRCFVGLAVAEAGVDEDEGMGVSRWGWLWLWLWLWRSVEVLWDACAGWEEEDGMFGWWRAIMLGSDDDKLKFTFTLLLFVVVVVKWDKCVGCCAISSIFSLAIWTDIGTNKLWMA